MNKHLIDGNLSNMKEMPSSNNFYSMKINYSQVVIFSKLNQSWYPKANHV